MKKLGREQKSSAGRAAWLVAMASVFCWLGFFGAPDVARAELDLKTLAKQSRGSVVLLEIFDGRGRKQGTGTGFFVDETTLVTNHHVIDGARSVSLRLADGQAMPVTEIMVEDEQADLAVLKTDRLPGVGLDLYRGPRVEPGEAVVVLGSPQGLSGTLSEGIVSAWREQEAGLQDFGIPILQISAPISSGSSGSPVMNEKGQVIGVAVAVHREGQNLNFAVPVDALRSLLARSGPEPTRTVGTAGAAERTTLIRNGALSLLAILALVLFLRRL